MLQPSPLTSAFFAASFNTGASLTSLPLPQPEPYEIALRSVYESIPHFRGRSIHRPISPLRKGPTVRN